MVELHTATVKVIKDGRITVPQEIREIENINEGDFLRITIEKIVRPKQTE
jgi:bifunctional DNA-binding transcriptional regulator/antitoxin component of YhaV-PrlF toxin-antitoxin module